MGPTSFMLPVSSSSGIAIQCADGTLSSLRCWEQWSWRYWEQCGQPTACCPAKIECLLVELARLPSHLQCMAMPLWRWWTYVASAGCHRICNAIMAWLLLLRKRSTSKKRIRVLGQWTAIACADTQLSLRMMVIMHVIDGSIQTTHIGSNIASNITHSNVF
jgi:hypothetical protein